MDGGVAEKGKSVDLDTIHSIENDRLIIYNI
jgi:hypothetical protein